MARAGRIVAVTHEVLATAARPGVTTAELDALAQETIVGAGGRPNFLNYHGFPASVCISVDDQVVHGIPGGRELKLGDLVSFDCGAYVEEAGKQWHADGAVTVIVGDDGSEAATQRLTEAIGFPALQRRRDLIRITREAMWAGIAAAAVARRVGGIGAAIEDTVEALGERLEWTPELVEGYTGHGIGNALHEPPEVYNYRIRRRTPKLREGMVVCIEPMVASGHAKTRVLQDGWTVVTVSGSDAAHFEQTVARVPGGVAVLTAPDGGVEGLTPFGVEPVLRYLHVE